eukprot:412764_1
MPSLFTQFQKTSAAEKLKQQLSQNPTYPFQREFDGLESYYAHVFRYKAFWVACGGFTISLTLMFVLQILQQVGTSYFLYTVFMTVFALFIMYVYRQKCRIEIYPAHKTYSFYIGEDVIVTGLYHNVYIRLRKRIDSGTAYYYLIFNGYRIDKVIVSSLQKTCSVG